MLANTKPGYLLKSWFVLPPPSPMSWLFILVINHTCTLFLSRLLYMIFVFSFFQKLHLGVVFSLSGVRYSVKFSCVLSYYTPPPTPLPINLIGAMFLVSALFVIFLMFPLSFHLPIHCARKLYSTTYPHINSWLVSCFLRPVYCWPSFQNFNPHFPPIPPSSKLFTLTHSFTLFRFFTVYFTAALLNYLVLLLSFLSTMAYWSILRILSFTGYWMKRHRSLTVFLSTYRYVSGGYPEINYCQSFQRPSK